MEWSRKASLWKELLNEGKHWATPILWWRVFQVAGRNAESSRQEHVWCVWISPHVNHSFSFSSWRHYLRSVTCLEKRVGHCESHHLQNSHFNLNTIISFSLTLSTKLNRLIHAKIQIPLEYKIYFPCSFARGWLSSFSLLFVVILMTITHSNHLSTYFVNPGCEQSFMSSVTSSDSRIHQMGEYSIILFKINYETSFKNIF